MKGPTLRNDLDYYRNPNPSAKVWGKYSLKMEAPDFLEGPLVLDAGCGNGRSLRLLEDLGFEAVGLEINDDLVRTAAAKGEVVQSSITHMPFRSGSFGSSIVEGVMWYVRDIASAHSELLRVSRGHYTWTYAKFYRLSLFKPRSLYYFVKSVLRGRIFPRSRRALKAYGEIVHEDEKGYLFLSGQMAPAASLSTSQAPAL